jgi:hypothetical protein
MKRTGRDIILGVTKSKRRYIVTGLTDVITKSNWEEIFIFWFVIVDDAYLALEAQIGC